jgi:1,4-dihydroxy-2-naphthoate octaprenyltransferase
MIWSVLFTIGNFIYGRTAMGIILGLVFAGSTTVLIGVFNKLWSAKTASE